MDYSNLTLNQIIEKIKTSRFWDLPSMVAEAFKKIPQGEESYTPSYKVYSALIYQIETNKPEVIVLENTLGDISFTYLAVGIYSITSEGLFTPNKTFGLTTSPNSGVNLGLDLEVDDSTIILFSSYNNGSGLSTLVDGFGLSSIEIRVYN